MRTNEETVSIKVRLPKSTLGQLKDLAKEQGVPMANIIRQGITLVLLKQTKEDK